MRRAFLLVLAMSIACKDPDPLGEGLFVTPAVVDFGEVVVGLLARSTVVLDNRTPQVVRVIEARPADPISDAVRLERVPAALIAGGSAEADVVFAPPREGTFSGSIEIETDADPPLLSVEISGVAVAPFLRAIPEQIDFGRVTIGSVAVWTATISNEGSRAVTVDGITTDTESEEFSIGPYAIETLEPGESFTFEVSFLPTAGGRALGRLVIGDDSPRPVPLTISLMGEGVDGDLDIEPTFLDFSGAVVGEERVRFFEIRNTGTATHSVESLDLSQSDPPAFAISTASVALPFILGPGQERTLSVRFAPQIAGSNSGAIGVRSTAGSGEVSLFGIAWSPPVSGLVVWPRALEFGAVEIGSSGARELTIETAGFIEIRLEDELELDPPGAPFMLLRAPPAGAVLGSYDSHTIEVLYLPQEEESHQAILRILSDAADRPSIEVQLSGRGVSSPSPDADPRPARLTFGQVPRDLGALRTVVLFNGGTAPLSITGVELTEDAGGRFLLETVPGSGPFAAGQHREIQIRYFDPAGFAPLETGTVAIATDDPDRPLIRIPLQAGTTAPRLDEDADIRVITDGLDLHLIAGGSLFDRPTDCCWCNPNPAWANVEGSPFLDHDSTGGQSIRLSRANGRYLVEIHSRETAVRNVQVTIELFEDPPVVRMREVGPGQRWRVGIIDYDGFNRFGFFNTGSLPLDAPMDDSCY